MEFRFAVSKVLRPNNEGIATLRPSQVFPYMKDLSEVINRMGQLSAVAQGLPAPITTGQKFFSSPDNVLYVKVAEEKVVGFIKTGSRRLFHFSEGGVKELQPLCLLDFYVHESKQRSGYGKELYEFLLRDAQTQPAKIAIDRPSIKLQNFMRKHYNLWQHVPQSNNFVIYSQYFESSLPQQEHRPRLYPKEESKIRSVGKMVIGTQETRPTTVLSKEPDTRFHPKFNLFPRDTSARTVLRPPWGIVDDLPSYTHGEKQGFKSRIFCALSAISVDNMGNCCAGRNAQTEKSLLQECPPKCVLPRRSNPLPESCHQGFIVNGKKMPLDLRESSLYIRRKLTPVASQELKAFV